LLRLAVIPSDPIKAYKAAGYANWLEDYYNPLKFFDKVFLLSPKEKKIKKEFGMIILPTSFNQFKKRIKNLKIDIIRAYGGHWACDMACLNKLNNIPIVVSIHDTNREYLHDSIKYADIILCVSKIVRKLVLTKKPNPERVWLLPNRVDFKIMRRYTSEECEDLNKKYGGKYRILHVGRKSRQKNLDTVIKALPFLGKDYVLLAVGRGKKKQYIKLAEKLGVYDQCYFIDSLANTELARYYSWADCLCNPSRWEGFGIIFIEALACGAIVITSDIPPMNEYIEFGKNGLLLKEYENPVEMAKMIQIACTDHQLRTRIRENARESVRKFAKNKIDKLEVEYYKKILKMKQVGAFKISKKMLFTLFLKRTYQSFKIRFFDFWPWKIKSFVLTFFKLLKIF